jgi:alkanesulfonate monooxygenase SsuD/methylene tetrahydromethanopterin reductase-like flavin-dependent oxidoreductase (luciferase family)
MACVNVIAADSNEEAERLATSFYQLATGIITGKRRQLQPPVDSMEGLWSEQEEAAVKQMMHYAFVGDCERVGAAIRHFERETQLDELMVTSHIYDPVARIHSYEVLREAHSK